MITMCDYYNNGDGQIVVMMLSLTIPNVEIIFFHTFHLDHCGGLPWFLEKVLTLSTSGTNLTLEILIIVIIIENSNKLK